MSSFRPRGPVVHKDSLNILVISHKNSKPTSLRTFKKISMSGGLFRHRIDTTLLYLYHITFSQSLFDAKYYKRYGKIWNKME